MRAVLSALLSVLLALSPLDAAAGSFKQAPRPSAGIALPQVGMAAVRAPAGIVVAAPAPLQTATLQGAPIDAKGQLSAAPLQQAVQTYDGGLPAETASAVAGAEGTPASLAPSEPVAAPKRAGTVDRRYYLTGTLTRESEFGPMSYIIHYGLKITTVYFKTALLYHVGGLITAAVYLVFMPLKIAAVGRVQTGSIDQRGLRPVLRKLRLVFLDAADALRLRAVAPVLETFKRPLELAGRVAGPVLMAAALPLLIHPTAAGILGGLAMLSAGAHILAASLPAGRAWLSRLYSREDLDAVRETVKHPQVRSVVEGARVEQVRDGGRFGAIASLGWAIVTKMRHERRYLLATDGPLPDAPLAGAPAELGKPVEVAADAPVTFTAQMGDKPMGVSWTGTVGALFDGKTPAVDAVTADRLREATGRKWLLGSLLRLAFYVGASILVALPFRALHLDMAVGVTAFILLELEHKTNFRQHWRRWRADPGMTFGALLKALGREALADHAFQIKASVGGQDLGAVASGLGGLRLIGSGLRQQLRAALLNRTAAKPRPLTRSIKLSRAPWHVRWPVKTMAGSAVLLAAWLLAAPLWLLGGLAAFAALAAAVEGYRLFTGVTRTAGKGQQGILGDLLELLLLRS